MHGVQHKAGAFAPALRPAESIKRSLEVELGADLDDARFVRTGDLPEVGVAQASVDATEVGVVEHVEVLTAQLEFEVPAQVHILDGGEIPLLHAGSKQRLRTLGAEVSHGRGEGGGREPLRLGLGLLNQGS